MIHVFSVPGGPGVRVETFAHSDCTISPYYDSMIAKIIVHGRDRQEAIARMRRTLEMTVIEGIKTTIPLHLRILNDPDFVAGKLSTSFMDRFLARRAPAGASPKRSEPRDLVTSGFDILPSRLYVDLRRRGLRARAGWTLVDFAAACLDGGARLLQMRAKTLPARDLLEATAGDRRARRSPSARRSSSTIAPTSRGWPAPAACTSARTISTPARSARWSGPTRSSGCRRTRRAARRARCGEPIDYVAIGPVFGTAHEGDRLRAGRPRGACARGRRRAARGVPLVAIGGITRERARSVLDAGADSVAVISDLLKGSDPAARVREFLD